MTSREKFEAWWEQEKYDDKLNCITGIMFNRIKANMFLSWQASEEAMAVQLANAESKCRDLAALCELQERRKADNAEPVFFIEVEGDDWIQAGRIPGSTFDFNNLPDGINKLYATPPAPVVPDAIEPDYEVIKAILPTANPDEYACCIAADMWNACRAAMLQAGNSPVIPDCWIPVSERMPELDTRVLLYFHDYGGHIEDGCIGDEGDGPYHYFFDGDSLSHEPTHWMPLPASPHFREIGNSSTNNCRENAKTSTNPASLNSNVTIDCWCRSCRPVTMNDMRFVVCPDCGNKRCPHANDHRNDCTGSNEPGQIGSAYQAAPKQEE